MPMLLRIAGLPDAEGERLVEVDEQLRIGRAAENDLVLADEERVLSKTHCIIRRQGGGYVVVDNSTNGIFLNGARERLQPGEPASLRAGDSIGLGRFRLSVVSVIVPETNSDPEAEHMELLGPVSGTPPRRAEPPVRAPNADPADPLFGHPAPPPGSSVDVFLGDGEEMHWPALPPSRPTQPDHQETTSEGFRSVAPARESIPPHWDPLAGFRRNSDDRSLRRDLAPPLREPDVHPPVRTPAALAPVCDTAAPPAAHTPDAPNGRPQVRPPDPQPPFQAPGTRAGAPQHPPSVVAPVPEAVQAGPAPEGHDALRAGIDRMLRVCGVDVGKLTDAEALRAAEQAGQLLSIATDGMLRILGSRGVVKQAFHIERTAISQGANNPMKFTATASEALRLMLLGDLPGFLSAEDAMREAVSDIQSHQLSLVSTARVAADEVLRRLDPAAIEAATPRRTSDALPMRRKGHAWDAYRRTHARLRQAMSGEDGELLAQAFGRAHAAATQSRTATPSRNDAARNDTSWDDVGAREAAKSDADDI